MRVYWLTRILIIYNIKTQKIIRLLLNCSSEQNEKCPQKTLLWLESTGCAFFACPWGIMTEVDGVLLLWDFSTHWCTALGLQRHTELLLNVSSSLKKGRVTTGMFTCELFPSVIWSCMFGIQCSRHPYTGPCTLQYISVRTKARTFTHWRIILKFCSNSGSLKSN